MINKGIKMSKVYITQDNNRNYTPAFQYGTPIFVTDKEYSSVLNANVNREIICDIEDVVREYNPENDYVLPSGDVTVLAPMLIHAILQAHGYVTVLKWQNKDKMYTPIKLNKHDVDFE
tara:strand:- start:29 stop:382 length:354 start_codon:yes stop_codon:yes gene_type:complete